MMGYRDLEIPWRMPGGVDLVRFYDYVYGPIEMAT